MRIRSLAEIFAKAPTYLAFAKAQPGWLVMFLAARFSLVRRLYGPRPGRARPVEGSIFDHADAGAIVRDLADSGVHVGLRLPPALLDAIVRFACATPCYGDKDRGCAFLPDAAAIAAVERRERRTFLTGHYLDRIEDCPQIRQIAGDPLLAEAARAYLGGDARISRIRLWWSFAREDAPVARRRLAAQDHFHFDLGDWREMKVFFYLTPVDERSGPHVYVRGSHRGHRLADQVSLTLARPNADVVRAYGSDNVIVIEGAAGAGFAEDPYGFHMARSVRAGRRLMLEIGFGPSIPSRLRFYDERSA